MPSTLASFTKGKTAWYLRSSNPESENENYKYLKQSTVVGKANPKQGRATAESEFSYLRSSYLLEYMMAVNHTLFEEDSLQIPR